MKSSNRDLGALGEDFAATWLVKNGYQILDRNWRGERVELDIVARQNRTLVFVEVKTRRSNTSGYPAEAITPEKLARLKSAALQWLAAHQISVAGLRIDVMALLFDGSKFQVTQIRDIQ
jgi:putative endonuclease